MKEKYLRLYWSFRSKVQLFIYFLYFVRLNLALINT